jgi:hypothetical protein
MFDQPTIDCFWCVSISPVKKGCNAVKVHYTSANWTNSNILLKKYVILDPLK